MSADIDVGCMSTPDKLGVVLNPNQSVVVMDEILVSTYLPDDIMQKKLVHSPKSRNIYFVRVLTKGSCLSS